MRYFLIALILIGASQIVVRVISDMIERTDARQCVQYEERVQHIRKKVDDVHRVHLNKVRYCSEWIYEGM